MHIDSNIKSVEKKECLCCGGIGSEKYSNLYDRYFGNSYGWNIYQCSNCNLLWLNPMPTREEIGKAYLSYYTHVKQKKSIFNFTFLEKSYLSVKYHYYPSLPFFKKLIGYVVFLMPIIKNRFDFSVLYLPKTNYGHVLDFGCGNGWILHNLKRIGWNCYGLDFDPKAVEYCRSQGLNVNLGDIQSQNFPDDFFDAIIINHVIEHVHDVEELLKNCFKKLKKGGRLVVATPNTDNWQHRLYKKDWFQLDPPRHLHLFNIKNLEKIITRNNFSIVKSFSSIRMDAWSTIVTRGFKRKGRFNIGKDKKNLSDLVLGIFHQYLSFLLIQFNKNSAGEAIIIAQKQ